MTTTNAQKKARAQQGRTQKKSRAARAAAKRNRRVPRPMTLTNLERMIADPCNSPLSSVYSDQMGGGHVFRVRSRFRLRSVSTDSSGFVVWYPSFHNAGADGTIDISGGGAPAFRGGANLFSYSAAGTTNRPNNSTTTPFGSSVSISGVAGRALADPAFDIVDSSNVSEARTLAACMAIKYVGPTSARQGEFFIVNSLPQNGLMRRGGNVVNAFELMTYASKSCRTPSTDLEVIWRPNLESEFPRKVGDSAADANAVALEGPGADAPFVLGVPAGAFITQQGNSSLSGEPVGFGIAYDGLSTEYSNDIYVELTKVVQIRYSPLRGSVEMGIPPTHNNPKESSSDAASNLDAKLGPSWTTRLRESVGSVTEVTEAVLGGASIIRDVAAGAANYYQGGMGGNAMLGG